MAEKDIVTVSSKEALINAIKKKYKTIIIGGDDAQELAKYIRTNATGNAIANLSIIIGLFWVPAFFAGIGGKLLTREVKKYEVTDVDDEFVTIRRK